MRLWFILGVVAVVFYIYSIVDCAMFDSARVRALPKQAWVVIIVLLPVVGAVLWFTIGRGPATSAAPRAASRPTAPDDDAEFLARLRFESEQEKRIRQLEEKLAELDDGKRDTDPGTRDA